MTNKIIWQALALGLMALWLAVPAAQAQVEEAWVSQYIGPPPLEGWHPSDYVTDLAVRDGYVYVTGYESRFTAYWATVKYDYTGQEVWVQRVVDGQSQTAEGIAVDAAGNVYVTGYQKQVGAGGDALTVKYSPEGVILWEKLYVSPGGNNRPNDIAIDASGNIYVSGASWVTEQEEFDMLLLKYDSDGELLWDRTFDDGEENWDSGLALAIDPDGNTIVAGFTEPEAMLVKYSPTGDLLWYDKHVSYAPWDQWARVITDSTGNIYVLGEISLPGTPKYLWTAKYDPDGNILWEQPYTGTADESCYDGNLALMPDGGVVVTGQSWEVSGISIVTIRYDKEGTELWRRLENAGYAHTSGDDVAVDAEGRIYVTGYGYNYSYWEDNITLGYSPDGDLLWTQIYANPQPDGSDYPQAIAVDEDANVFVAAHSWSSETSNDYTTIMYRQGALSAELTCLPSSGTLPFSTVMTATLSNLYTEQSRRISGHIDVTLASAQLFTNWRAGFTNIAGGASYVTTWNQTIPAYGSVVGENVFQLLAQDVTPPPYNQPPYPPAGDTATATCTVTGIAP